MWRRSRRAERARRGFSLAEATVSLTLLIIVMVVSLTLLFSMRSFAERQQFTMEPRQTARRGVDYLLFFLAGATDANSFSQQAPNAIVTYYNSDASNNASLTQATYNNLTGTEAGNAPATLTTALGTINSTDFGDLGTDIVSVSLPIAEPVKYPIFAWPTNGTDKDLYVGFRAGCAVNDAANLALFQQATLESGGKSPNNLMVIDSVGNWTYLKIKQYMSSNCAAANDQVIHVKVNPGQSQGADGPIAPPNGPAALTEPAFLLTGIGFFSFRVRTDPATGIPNLEQKNGLFDPATDDNPATTTFVPVIENVEDFQIAYLYASGAIWNTPVQQMSAGMADCLPCLTNVPFQAGPSVAPSVLDASNVVGLRINVVARSRPMTLQVRSLTATGTGSAVGTSSNRHFRPAAEDHAIAAAYDNFEHYRATTTVMLRNRTPRN